MHRKRAFITQSGFCYYCNQPMWVNEKDSFCAKYYLKTGDANLLQCTAEHLKPRQDGGKDSAQNIVAACKFCNHTRHKAKSVLVPEMYKKRVRMRLSKNLWHQIIINPI